VNIFVCVGFFVDTSILVFSTSLITQGHQNEVEKMCCLFKYFSNSCGLSLARRIICLVFETRFSQRFCLASFQQKRRWKWREGSVSCLSVYFLRVEREAWQHTHTWYAVKKMHPYICFPISTSHRQSHQVLYNNPS